MKLHRVRVQNFKSISPTGVELTFRSSIIFLVGKNNAGKTCFLEAIDRLLGKENPGYARKDISDYNDQKVPIVIEAEFVGLDHEQGRKIGLSEPQCGQLMSSRGGGQKGRITLTLTLPPLETEFESEDPGDGLAKEEDDKNADPALLIRLANKHVVRRTEKIRKQIAQLSLVPAVRDPEKLLTPSSWTPFGGLLRDLLTGSENEQRLRELLTEADGLIKKDLSSEATALKKVASSTSYVESIEFQLTREKSPVELLRNIELLVGAHGRKDVLSRLGSGTQSVVAIGMLEIALRQKRTSGQRLFIVEEPELFLHPQAQRFVGRLLREGASSDKAQLIVSTHSRDILSGADLLDIAVLRKDASSVTSITQPDPEKIDFDVAERYLSGNTAEVFFSDRCILVEGESDRVLLQGLSRIVKSVDDKSCDLDEKNISVVEVGGKGRLPAYSKLLDEHCIPWRIVADRDSLEGDTLNAFREGRPTETKRGTDEEIKWLRKKGVAVLTDGEIEDYYPQEAICPILNCSVDKFSSELAKRRLVFDEPTLAQLFCNAVLGRHAEIVAAPVHRLPKLVPVWYNQALEDLRSKTGIARPTQKTGKVLEEWSGCHKYTLARRVLDYFKKGGEVPEKLVSLVRWIVAD